MNVGTDCRHCDRLRVRRPHGGVMVCPYCDLNEPAPPYPRPPLAQEKRPPTNKT